MCPLTDKLTLACARCTSVLEVGPLTLSPAGIQPFIMPQETVESDSPLGRVLKMAHDTSSMLRSLLSAEYKRSCFEVALAGGSVLAGFVRARQTSAHRPRLEPIIKPSPPSGVAITRCRVAHHTSSNITRRISAAPGAKSLQRRIACIFTTDRHLPSYVVGVAATVALYRKYERVGVYVTFKTIHLLRFNGMYPASCKFRHEGYLATTDARTVPEYRVDHRICTLYSTNRPILR